MPIEGICGRGAARSLSLIAGMALVAGLTTAPAVAATQLAPPAGGPIYEAIVLDAETGQVLRQLNPDTVTYPASLTKMMTLYLTFEALNQNRIQLDQYFPVSEWAASQHPSKLGLRPGESISVRDLILGIVTKSANDAAVVLAEGLGGGNESAFAVMMTQKARQLGMTRTSYRNASGLPDSEQLTTARDIARLALALIHDFPREYRYFSVREFNFEGRIVNGHDHLLDEYPGTDGIKTGFTVASGYNLATSAVRDGHRLIGVILGGESGRIRDGEMAQLLDIGFADLAREGPMLAQRTTPAAPVMAAQAAPVAAPPTQVAALPAEPPRSLGSMAAASMSGPPAQPPAAEPEPEHPSTFAAVASAAIDHLAPVSRAEAAPVAPEPSPAWGVQLGIYHEEAAAARAERKLEHLAVADGKETVIVTPGPGDRSRVYRLLLLHFTAHGAHAACDELHHQGFACSVVPPAAPKVASR
jgi:D-alanyl-D-alanine carboxypeptidase